MKLRTAVAAAAVGGAALVPAIGSATAQAATLAVNAPCYVYAPKADSMITIAGAGFTPDDPISVTDSVGGIDADPTADATGAFTITVPTPQIVLSKPGIQADTITADDDPLDGPEITATAATDITQFDFSESGTHRAPGLSALSEVTTWKFSGFPAGAGIYGHYTYDGKLVAKQSFGRAQGPCGVLTVRKRLYPATPHHKTYTVQVDASRTYSRHTSPSGRLKLTLGFF